MLCCSATTKIAYQQSSPLPSALEIGKKFRVASHLCTGRLAGIGIIPALVGWYIRYGIGITFYCKIWRELININVECSLRQHRHNL